MPLQPGKKADRAELLALALIFLKIIGNIIYLYTLPIFSLDWHPDCC